MINNDMYVIHPTPYYKKLAEVRRTMEVILSIAPEKDRPELLVVQGILDKLFEQR